MKSKLLSLFLMTAILSIAMISAADLTFTQSTDSQTFTSALTDTLSVQTAIATKYNDGTTIIPTSVDFTNAPEVFVSTTADYDELDIGVHTGNLIIANATDNETKSVEFIKTFCEEGEKGNVSIGLLELADVKIDNDDGDDNEWTALDSIVIEVKVENNGDDRVRDVVVELGLIDSDGKNIIDDMKDLDNEKIDLGSINEDDDDTATFTFKVPGDFEDGDYQLVVKTYSDDEGEDEVCASKSSDLSDDYYEAIDGQRETDEENHMIVDNIRLNPSSPACSDLVQVSAEIFNVGDEDYEDQVKVTLYNKELGVDLEQTIRKDLDQGDSYDIEFEIEIPGDAEEKTYALEFRTYYDYDDKDDLYNIVSEKRFFQSFSLEGNCEIIPESSVKITAKLDTTTPEAMAGKQVVIQATLENTGDATTLYTVSISGNSAWSSLSEIDPTSVIIEAGESKTIDIILDVDEDAEGDKEFTIKASHDTLISEQKVALSITAKSGMTGAALSDHIKANGFIYAIVLINLILIIAIILVIRRMVVTKPSRM